MHDALTIYFDGEKNAGLFLAGVGVAVIAAAVFMLRSRVGLRSFAVTLIVLAVAEIALGVGLYLRTGPQVSRLVAQMSSAETRFYADEGTRMARVQKNFVTVEYIEVAIIILSAIVALTQKSRPGIAGVALGLLIHGAILLAFDLIAERRGTAYEAAIARSGAPAR